jgi:(R,R)-butanediol dehydrogenase/meso-butanediol dehydrogenase/diacetyl reductase
MSLEGGGYAEYALTHERQCIVLPRSISLADGALVEPLAVALHAVNVAGLASGQTVLVVGAGPIGLATCWWARHRGAPNVVVRDLSPERCERARSLGATDIEVGSAGESASASSYDLVFDCAGALGVLADSIACVKPRGTIVLLGLCTVPDSFVPFLAIRKEVRILTAVFFSRREFEEALDALAHVDQLARVMVTATVTLAELPGKFDALRTGSSGECKVLIAPHGVPDKPRIPARNGI